MKFWHSLFIFFYLLSQKSRREGKNKKAFKLATDVFVKELGYGYLWVIYGYILAFKLIMGSTCVGLSKKKNKAIQLYPENACSHLLKKKNLKKIVFIFWPWFVVCRSWSPDSMSLAGSAIRCWREIIWRFWCFPPDFSRYPYKAGSTLIHAIDLCFNPNTQQHQNSNPWPKVQFCQNPAWGWGTKLEQIFPNQVKMTVKNEKCTT